MVHLVNPIEDSGLSYLWALHSCIQSSGDQKQCFLSKVGNLQVQGLTISIVLCHFI